MRDESVQFETHYDNYVPLYSVTFPFFKFTHSEWLLKDRISGNSLSLKTYWVELLYLPKFIDDVCA